MGFVTVVDEKPRIEPASATSPTFHAYGSYERRGQQDPGSSRPGGVTESDGKVPWVASSLGQDHVIFVTEEQIGGPWAQPILNRV